ncbi:MAG: nicotinate phosphoribosyltransferase, partial [Solobacterium sp.]|nr:nicotinate phosphoribosyltransferase [Solobacterium sp.]
KLVASNALDETKIENLEHYQDAHFDSYGVGENLITSATSPVFGGVYKLVAVKNPDGTYAPKMKCSDSASKAIIPGKLMAWRVFDKEGKGQCDIIAMDDEEIKAGEEISLIDLNPDAFDPKVTLVPYHVEKLLVPFIINGEAVQELPGISEKKAYIKDQLENRMWEGELRRTFPHMHYVDMTEKVARCREDMYRKLHGGTIK